MSESMEGAVYQEQVEKFTPRTTGYHYMSPGGAEWVLKGHTLDPLSPLVRYPDASPGLFPREAFTLYTFAFMNSPRPKEWIHNKKLPSPFDRSGSWSSLMAFMLSQNHMYEPTLEIIGFDVLGTDEAFVVDWGEVQKQTLAHTVNALYKREVYPEISPAQGWLNYLNSKTPLSQLSTRNVPYSRTNNREFHIVRPIN